MKYLIILSILILASCASNELSPNEIKYEQIESRLKVGTSFPNFSLINDKNEYKNQESFNQGYVFYMFWATWCSSCIDNIIAVKEMKRSGLLKNVQFVSVSFDKEESKWKQFINQYDLDDYMENLLVGHDKEHALNDFRYMEMSKGSLFGEKKFNYIIPVYCLVENGIIKDRKPVLPKEKDKFLRQF